MRKIYLLILLLSCVSAVNAQSGTPVITSFTPVSGTYRDAVLIKGSGFLGTNMVTFGGVRCIFMHVLNDSTIETRIGYGNTGDVAVITANDTVVKSGFTYNQPLQVSSFSPAYGAPGTTVTITGGPFNADPAANIIQFGTVQATVLTATANTLTAKVPVDATSAQIRVQANGTGGYSSAYFLVSEPGEMAGDNFSFSQPKAIDAGYTIRGVAAADFDGDGKQDAVAINKSTSMVSVFKNSSTLADIAFAPKIDLPAGGMPVELITGDVDVDGKTDIIIKIVEPDKIVVFRNTSSNGAISFENPVGFAALTFEIHPPHYGRTMAMKDLDGDGKPEIVSADAGHNTLSLFRNTGTTGIINFAAPVEIPYGISPMAIVVEDFDGDGKADISSINNGSFFSTFRNTSSAGNISFAAPVKTATGLLVLSFTADDYDGDGKPDVAMVISSTRSLTVFRNTSAPGAISFAPKVERALAYLSSYVDKGDFDGDGKKDWLILSETTNASISKNASTSGAVVAQLPQDFRTDIVPEQSVITDLNGDGKPDILATEYFGRGVHFIRNTLHEPVIKSFFPIVAGEGDSVRISGVRFSGATEVRFGGVVAGSFTVLNDSSIVAVVGAGATGDVAVTNVNGTGKESGFIYGKVPLISSIAPLSGPVGTTVKITGKNFDPAVANNTVYFGAVKAPIITASDSLITATIPAGVTYEPITVVSKKLSAIWPFPFVTTFPGGSKLNSESFAPKKTYQTGDSPEQIAIGDIDNDGKPDVVIMDFSQNFASIYRNTSVAGSIELSDRIDLPIYANAYQVVLADLNGDGKKDVICVGNGIVLHQNTSIPGTISFKPKQHYLGGSYSRSVAVGDVNGDGLLDLMVVDYLSSKITILKNTSAGGDIAFQNQMNLNTGLRPESIVADDFNNDGKTDLAVANNGQSSFYVFTNTSSSNDFSFSLPKEYTISNSGLRRLYTGDIDGDNKVDIIVCRIGGFSAVGVFRNTSTEDSLSFAAQVGLPIPIAVWRIGLGDLNGDAKPDILTAPTKDSVLASENLFENGNIIFSSGIKYQVLGEGIRHAEIGDLDGDGKADILAVSINSNSLSILRNKMAEALVIPSGTNPVTGGMTNTVTIDATVQTYQGHPYVQRHYDVAPINDPATATATITLYFTQQEFDNYNAHPAHGLDLPHHGADDFNKANLRVYQYHGFSTTSLPGSYSGNGVEIDPDDTKIVWNATTVQWEVTFDINGFSGFFVSSAGNSLLPVTFLSFTGQARDQSVKLQWTTTRELNVAHFEVQRRDNTSDYVTIGKIAPAGTDGLTKDYSYTDELGAAPVYYYRLKVVDIDESATYSKTIMVKPALGQSLITLGPNPASSYVVVKHPASPMARLRITDLSGRVLKTVAVANHAIQTRVGLTGLAKGTYSLVWEDGTLSQSLVLVVQ